MQRYTESILFVDILLNFLYFSFKVSNIVFNAELSAIIDDLLNIYYYNTLNHIHFVYNMLLNALKHQNEL